MKTILTILIISVLSNIAALSYIFLNEQDVTQPLVNIKSDHSDEILSRMLTLEDEIKSLQLNGNDKRNEVLKTIAPEENIEPNQEVASDDAYGKPSPFKQYTQQESEERARLRSERLLIQFESEPINESWSIDKQLSIDQTFTYSNNEDYKNIDFTPPECRSKSCKFSAIVDETEVELDLAEFSFMEDMHKLGLSKAKSYSTVDSSGQLRITYFFSVYEK